MPTIISQPVEAQSQILEAELIGEVNGIAVKGHGYAFYDAETNINGGILDYEDVPELGNIMMASSTKCKVSAWCCVFSRPTNGAVNLISIIGRDRVKCDAEYTMIDPDGKLIGELRQDTEFGLVAPGHYRGHTIVEGWHEGPKDLKWTDGYPIYLRQVDRGVIEGVYAQTIIRETGHFYELIRRRYYYDNDYTPPFHEILSYKMLNNNITVGGGRRVFDFRASAYYAPAEPQHGTIETSDRNFEKMMNEFKLTPMISKD